MDSVIHLLNNWGLVRLTRSRCVTCKKRLRGRLGPGILTNNISRPILSKNKLGRNFQFLINRHKLISFNKCKFSSAVKKKKHFYSLVSFFPFQYKNKHYFLASFVQEKNRKTFRMFWWKLLKFSDLCWKYNLIVRKSSFLSCMYKNISRLKGSQKQTRK